MGFSDRSYYGSDGATGFGPKGAGFSVVTWLVAINAIVFVVDNILAGSQRGSQWAPFIWGNFNIAQAIDRVQIWRLLTFQFLHANFFHILFNMWALYVFGPRIEQWWGSRRFLAFYLLCGCSGALVFTVLSYFPALLVVSPMSSLVGASGGLFGVLIATAVLYPNDRVMLLIPPIPLKMRTLALVLIGIAVFSLAAGSSNAGGEAAHLGGAILGFLLIRKPSLLNWVNGLPARQPYTFKVQKSATPLSQNKNDARRQENIDRILAKVERQGLHSLTWWEKRALNRESQRLRDR